jgi:hypothetical protein
MPKKSNRIKYDVIEKENGVVLRIFSPHTIFQWVTARKKASREMKRAIKRLTKIEKAHDNRQSNAV